MISLSSMLLIKFVLVVCFLSIALISTTEATAHHVYLSAKSSPNAVAAAAANQIGSYESYKLKPNSYYKIELPSLRLPCKRYSCRFGNCENLIVNNVLNYTCHCVRGVAGPNCDLLDTEKLPCSSNPCYGGAKCFNYMDDYYCECPEGRDGKNCNSSTPDATDPCRTNPCGSQGICFTATNGYWCFCNDGKHGFSCNNAEERIITTRLCSSQDTCLNGGRCIPMNNSIICACKSNFYGPRCEFKLKSRNSAAAAIGDANSGSGSAMGSGSGLVGAVGAATSSRESCLTNVCLNNGSCAIKKGRVTCLCDTFYTGKFCESSVFVPCGKGSCNNLNGICIMDKCYCFRGYFGDKCQSDLKSLLSFSTNNNNKYKFDLSN